MNKLIAELRRRNVFRVAGVYLVVAWIVTQIVAAVAPMLGLPPVFGKGVLLSLAAGFPIALVLAWAFELTPEGVKRTKDVAADESIAVKTGRRLDYAILAGLALVAVIMVWQSTRPASPAAVVARNAADSADAPDPASIAVLPFVDLSPEGDQEYFSEGIAEEILNVLAGVNGLKVASRTSAFAFRGQTTLGIPVIAHELKVRHVLEGSVRRSGQTIRITAQLIDADTDQHLWSETFDRTLTAENLFAIQDDIANAIVSELSQKMPLTSAAAPTVSVAADTQNLDAYEMYLEANALFVARGRENVRESFRLFEKVTELDPDFARGWAGLAAAASIAPSWGIVDLDYQAAAVNAAEKAIALNPDLSMPYAALGEVNFFFKPRNFEQAILLFDKALATDPGNATAVFWRGEAFLMLGYFDKADADFEKCLELDPGYTNALRFLAASNVYQGNYDRAREILDQVILAGGLEPSFGIFFPLYTDDDRRTSLLWLLSSSVRFALNDDGAWMVEPLYRVITGAAGVDRNKEYATFKSRLTLMGVSQEGLAGFANSYRIAFGAYDEMQAVNWAYQWHPMLAGPQNAVHRKRLIVEFGLVPYWRKHGFPPQCRPVGDNDFECG